MASVDLWIKPYEARQAYTKKGSQTTISVLLSGIVADVDANLPYICKLCYQPEDLARVAPYPTAPYGEGLIVDPKDPTKKIQCPNCGGFGRTSVLQVTPPQTYTPANIPPTVEQP